MLRKTAVILMLLCLAVVFAGCNTINGIGKDIRSLGQVIEEASD